MDKEQIKRVANVAAQSVVATVAVSMAQELLKDKTIGGKKIVLFTANR